MPYSYKQYSQAARELAQNKNESQQTEIAKRLLSMLKKEGSTRLLPNIIKELTNLEKRARERKTIRVTTAVELNQKEKEVIKKRFGEGSYNFTRDPKCIAGMVAQKDNSLFYSTLSKAVLQFKSGLVA